MAEICTAAHAAASGVKIRTGVWNGDLPLRLEFPGAWDVALAWPRTPPPLTVGEIAASLDRPVGQPPLPELCRGKKRPLIIIDDLNRPTPSARIIPHVLERFDAAGIPPGSVRILLATGTHGAPRAEAVRQKVGAEGARCRILVHDSSRDLVGLGRTSFGTPVAVNAEVASSDFVMGIGGIYPNQTAGFGGGSKLALGVLGRNSIAHLHFRHGGIGWGHAGGRNGIRKDLDEIAAAIGLRTIVSVHVDANREIVRLTSGDHLRYYPGEVEFALAAFAAPLPGDADVVISNAWPGDLSFTSVYMKGVGPLQRAAPSASRIVVASCSDGAGHHGLFPVVNHPPLHRARQILSRLRNMPARRIAAAVAARVARAGGTAAPRRGAPFGYIGQRPTRAPSHPAPGFGPPSPGRRSFAGLKPSRPAKRG